MVSEYHVRNEKFLNLDDALYWYETTVKEVLSDPKYTLYEARIVYLNGHYSCGVSWGPAQQEFQFEGTTG